MAATISGASLQGIYNRLNAIPAYHPMDAQTFADWSVEAGDVVTVSRGSESYSSPVSTARMVWKGTPEVQLTSTGNKQRNPVSTESQRKYKRGSAAKRTQEIIQTTLTDDINDVSSTVTQLSNSWSVIVEGTGANSVIKPAAIQASIDSQTGTSKIHLSADKILLDGATFADYFATQSITLQDIVIHEGSDIDIGDDTGLYIGDDVGFYYGGSYHPFAYCLTDAEISNSKVHFKQLNGSELQVYVSGNSLIFKDADNNQLSFSKATSLSSGWSGEIGADTGRTYTVSALPASVGIDPVELKLYDGNFHNFTGTWDGNKYTGKIVYSIPAGAITQYADTGLRYEVDVTNKLQEKTVTPTASQQTITPDAGKIGFSSVIVEAGGGGSGEITTVKGTAINEHLPEYSGTMTVSGTNITNSPYEVGIGINHSTFIPQGASSAVPCVNILHGDTVIARQDVTVSAKTPTFTYNASTHKYTASTKAMAWGVEYGNAITADSGTEAYDSFDYGAYTLYDYDEAGYSPSPKRYTLTSGSGSSAVCNMGIIVKNSRNATTKTFTFNAPVTYAYRDGYEKGKSSKLVTDDIQIDDYTSIEKGTNAPSLKNAINHAQSEKTWLSFRVYIKGTSPLVQKYYKMNFTNG